METSALSTALDNLEKSWSSLDWWLNFWTILVVIGVAVELVVLVTECTHDWRDFKRGVIHSPEKPSLIIFGLGFLGVGLVTVGVAGEFRIHVKAGRIEADMRRITQRLTGLLNKEAGDARSEAAKANERVGNAIERTGKSEWSNLQLRKELSVSATQLAAEQVKLQKEQQTTAKAQKDATDAQRKMNAALATRILGRKVKPEMTNDLKKFPAGKAEIQFLDDAEARSFARGIQEALTNSRWEIMGDPVALPPNRFNGKELPLWGITVFDDHHKGSFLFGPISNPVVMAEMLSSSSSPSTDEIRFAVLAVGIEAWTYLTDTTLPSNFLRIVIGPRSPYQ